MEDSTTNNVGGGSGSLIEKRNNIALLNLPLKNVSCTDQTPTPTRFIRNCEEVGLFQDLQNVNPFEETFRKAIEATKRGDISYLQPTASQSANVDDSLHTPLLFPIETNELELLTNKNLKKNANHSVNSTIGNELLFLNEPPKSFVPELSIPSSISSPKNSVSSENASLVTIDDKNQICKQSVSSTIINMKSIINDEKINQQNSVKILLKIPDGRLFQLPVQNVAEELSDYDKNNFINCENNNNSNDKVILMLTLKEEFIHSIQPTTANIPTRQRLKESILRNTTIGSKDINSSIQNNVLPKKLPLPCKTNYSIENQPEKKKPRTPEEEENERRKMLLERNRIAAMRCREKRKNDHVKAQLKVEFLLKKNQELIREIKDVKEEVAALKTLLLAHEDCPITQALAQGQGVAIPSTTSTYRVVLSADRNEMQTLTSANRVPENYIINKGAKRSHQKGEKKLYVKKVRSISLVEDNKGQPNTELLNYSSNLGGGGETHSDVIL